jgi:hypothetical protein
MTIQRRRDPILCSMSLYAKDTRGQRFWEGSVAITDDDVEAARKILLERHAKWLAEVTA